MNPGDKVRMWVFKKGGDLQAQSQIPSLGPTSTFGELSPSEASGLLIFTLEMEYHLLIISSCDEWKEASTTASQLDIQRLRICKHMDFFSWDIACALKAIFLHDYNLSGGTYEG